MSELEQNDLFELLVDVSRAAEENALPMPDEKVQAGDWRGIGFRLDGQIYVAPMSEVDEVLTLPTYTKVPGVKAWMNGVANIRGRLLSVIDLGQMLGGAACNRSVKNRLLAVRKDDLYSGVIVDEVLGLQTFSSQEQQPCQQVAQEVEPYVQGAFEKDGQSWTVFSLYQLVDAPEFLSVTA